VTAIYTVTFERTFTVTVAGESAEEVARACAKVDDREIDRDWDLGDDETGWVPRVSPTPTDDAKADMGVVKGELRPWDDYTAAKVQP
jgi:hypothetical protein